MAKVLLVDDEVQFRTNLADRLKLRDYEVIQADNGEEAVRLARNDLDIDVIVLDRKMPGMSGEQTLLEIKTFRPAVQIIMLTGHSSMKSAMETGRLEAYGYLQKPCELDQLIKMIEEAREDRVHVMARHEIPHVTKGSLKKWLIGSHNSRPGIIMLGLIIFMTMLLIPSPEYMMNLLASKKTNQQTDANLGYPGYRYMNEGENIAEYYSHKWKMYDVKINEENQPVKVPQSPEKVSVKVRVMLGVLILAALFWASGAIPVGITALLVGVFMYFAGILKPDDIVSAYAKDAVEAVKKAMSLISG